MKTRSMDATPYCFLVVVVLFVYASLFPFPQREVARKLFHVL